MVLRGRAGRVLALLELEAGTPLVKEEPATHRATEIVGAATVEELVRQVGIENDSATDRIERQSSPEGRLLIHVALRFGQ